MMPSRIPLLLTVILLFSAGRVIAQELPGEKLLLEDLFPRSSYFEGSLGFLSNNVYMGRKDSVSIPYLTPSFGYYDKSGLFANIAVSFLPGAGRVDLVTVEAGYLYSQHNFSGGVYLAKYFYNEQSTNVQAEVEGSMHLTSSYNLGFIKPTLEAGINFSERSDYIVSFGLNHSFYLFDDAVDITPGVILNASTQNYYNYYYSKRRYTGKRKRRLTGILYYDITADISDAAKFQVRDYEFNLPLNYTVKKFMFNFTPTFALPINPAEVNLSLKASTGQVLSKTFKEKLQNSIFFAAGVTYQL